MSHSKYDVFISFRGEDTRENFTSHLHAELRRQNIETFIDNRLVRGQEISPALCKAIEESAIYVVILSEHYASSTWCLEELTKILECKERYGREVIPIFYRVDPSNVRHQRQSYADDFVKHHLCFGDKVDVWKAALSQVANLSGWDSQKIRPDSNFVEEIVKDIVKKLSSCASNDHEEKIGIDKHLEQIQTLLHLESLTVRILGIWGMGGIGKTEIAGAIYEKLATHFSFSGIVKNVQQEIKLYGVDHVKSKYLSHLLVQQDKRFNVSFDPRLKRTNVLLVFDDVKDSDQFIDLIGTCSNFGLGSRIIVTSRDKQVLKNANVDEIYHVVEMDDNNSLQLFCLNAFKQKEPRETYVTLTTKVLNYAKGVPLALKVLGLFLQDRAKESWESELQKLEKIPEPGIFNVLKLSYDGLDDEQKDIFLDIACLCRGEAEECVVQTLDCYGFSTRIGMDVLQDRSLISISEGRVWMHDRIQEMGHEIVRQQSVNNPEKRSRLHKPDDIYDVLTKNKGQGTDAIQSIVLDLNKIKKVQLHAKTFKKMHNLKMIQFYKTYWFESYSNVTFHTFLNSFPDNLKFLGWTGFPQKSLPQDFCPNNLVALDMPSSDLEQLWERDQTLPNLKRLDLSYSEKIIGLPDLSLFPNIEEIILTGCLSLEQVYSSSILHKLNWLYADGCTSLKSLSIPSNILSRSTGSVHLYGCRNLETILITSSTDVYGYLNCEFDDKTVIDSYFARGYGFLGDIYKRMFSNFNEFCCLDLLECESLTCLPAEFFNLKFLTRFRLSGSIENLVALHLDGTAITELPSSLHHLVRLEELTLRGCRKLKTIPSSIGNLSKLLKLHLTYCDSLETFPSSIFKLKLTALDFNGCSMLRTFPEVPSDIGVLSSLTEISLRGTNIVTLPDSMVHLSSLTSLDLSDCKSLECIPKLPPCLNELLAFDCTSIKKVVQNPLLKLMSDSNDEMDSICEFHLTNSEELEASSWSYIVNEALIKITDNAYLSALFCFPGSKVPDWFIHRCQGHSITVKSNYEHLCSEKKLIGFALCFVFRDEVMDGTRIGVRGIEYKLSFISDSKLDFSYGKLNCEYRDRSFIQNHTLIWNHQIDLARISNSFFDAYNINFEILGEIWPSRYQLNVKVKECGLRPLFITKEPNASKAAQ
ncbi:disease resistance protein RPV1-like [Vicia villosa]|uniref:disease resistance protein RPV1-like n=1 Tax=Vicia villosa TaxID=3911 RepID=UPI00273BBCEA|nr:disease resistance protein RPV1-like [Vicia villosa]XP_058758852.1 disease resistance protein RPV1-like [Vicia villosa]XP_058758853.1 disease resistance protein RPV1-like [Vicia villosa]